MAKQLADEQQRQEPSGVQLPEHDGLDRGIADALDVIVAKIRMQRIDQEADEQHPEDVPYVRALDPVELVFEKMQTANKARRGEAGNHAENGIKKEQQSRTDIGVLERRQRHDEGRLVAKKHPPDEGRGSRRQRHRQESPDADFGHHQLDCEQHAADRRIEGRSDAAAGAGGNENDALPLRHADDLAQGRAERRADLDDRPLAADGRSAADRDRRGERLHDSDDRADHAAIVVNRIHDLGHTVPFRFGSEFGDEEGDADGPDHRHEDHERSPWAGRGEDVGVVADRKLAEEQEIVNQTDQIPENDRAEAGDDANR